VSYDNQPAGVTYSPSTARYDWPHGPPR